MKKRNLIFTVSFITLLSLFAIFTLVLPSKAFSENENRPLAQKPHISMQDILAGNFQKEFSNYINDQIPFRETGIKVNTIVKKLLGRKEINDVYIGKDNYYISKFTNNDFSQNKMNSIFNAVETFSKQYDIPSTLMLVPSPGTILKDKLPSNAPYYDENVVYKNAKSNISFPVIDLRDAFSDVANDNQLYYYTDHHWTCDGAYIAYTKYCEQLGIQAKSKEYFEIEKVSDSFYGTIYSKLLDPATKADSIYISKNIPKIEVSCEEKEKSESIYNYEFLDKKDKYAVFLGGNYSKVEIKTNVKNGKQLLIIKDSFANSFVPFLLEDFEKIVMIDLRYFNSNIDDVITQNNINNILYLYETSNLLTDKGIIKLASQKAKPKPEVKPKTEAQESTDKNKKSKQNIKSLFIGDSRVIGLADFAPMDNANYFATVGMTSYYAKKAEVSVPGIGKTKLEKLLKSKKYDTIQLMLGINELGCSFDKNIKAYKELLDFVSELQPKAKIIIMGNLHVTKSRSISDEYINNKAINNFNNAISKFADGKNIFYINPNPLFDDNEGNLSTEKSADNAHLKPKGYKEFNNWLILEIEKLYK